MLKRDKQAEPIEGQIEAIEGESELVEGRIAKILDALGDGWLRYKSEVAIYPMMDALQLLIQKPLAFAIVRAKDFKPIFSTYHDPEHKNVFEKILDNLRHGSRSEGHLFALPNISHKPDFKIFASQITRDSNFRPPEDSDVQTLQRLIETLHGRDHARISSFITQVLNDIASDDDDPDDDRESPKGPPPGDFECDDDLRFLEEKRQEEYTEWMRSIVSKALDGIEDSRMFQNVDWTNLYCSIRRAVPTKRCEIFPYTVQYVLSNQQTRDIEDYYRDLYYPYGFAGYSAKPPVGVARSFEKPLGKQRRSISDSVFNSGVNQFAWPILQHSSDSSERMDNKSTEETDLDLVRDNAEQKVLGRHTTYSEEGGRPFFVVPIHVGGVVFATFFITNTTEPKREWYRNFALYRTLLTQIADRFRVAAKNKYRDCLIEAFRSELTKFEKGEKSKKAVQQDINHAWRKLTAYFPYHLVQVDDLQLIAIQPGDRKKIVPLTKDVNPHPCFQQFLPGFDILDDEDISSLRYELAESLTHSLIVVDRRRLALRTASAAIMGRNMSHNIGSHVLARYSTVVGREQEPETDKDTNPSGDQTGRTTEATGAMVPATRKPDHRGEFLSYLQRRMDFLAEIATSDKAHWSAPLSLKTQIEEHLNFKNQEERFPSGKPILLSHITGKQDLKATVKWGNPPDSKDADMEVDSTALLDRVDCPGGEVGIHAFYIILENIIRNSARHAPMHKDATDYSPLDNPKDWLCLYVDIKQYKADRDRQPDSNLLQIEIIDPRTELDKEGFEKGLAHTDQDSKKSLPARINDILKDSPVDDSGAPKPRYWGIREMQICAHYLRRISLDDLTAPQDPLVLEAGIHDFKSGQHCLKYKLYMERPKLMAAVVADAQKWVAEKHKLRRNGVVVVHPKELVALPENEGDNIAEQVGQYGFLLVEDDLPSITTPSAALPIRRLKRPARTIHEHIEAASKTHGMEWVEALHKNWAEECRDNRKDRAWHGRHIWGVVLGSDGNDAVVRCEEVKLSKGPEGRDDGFFCKSLASGALEPLPNDVRDWHDRLKTAGNSMGAVWLDHVKNAQLGNGYFRVGRAGMGQVALPQRDNPRRFWIAAEVLLSESPHADYLKTCSAEGGWELLAAAMTRVVVFDERVQAELEQPTRSGLSVRDVLHCMGVWVPPIEQCCNLETPVLGKCRNFLNEPAPERTDQYPVDVFVVHLSVIEALRKGTTKTLDETLEELRKGTQVANAETVIVTGRGVPDLNIPNVRYLPISALLESLVRRPSKLALMRSLWSAKHPPIRSSSQCLEVRGE